MVSNIPFGSYQPERNGLPQNVLLNFRLEFPKSDLTIGLASGFFFASLAREGKREQITEIKGEGMIAG